MSRLTTLRVYLLIPGILAAAATGAFIYKGQIADLGIACVFAVLGYYMKATAWPRVSLVIGFVLGSLFESNLQLTLRLQELGRINVWTRPIALTLMGLTLISLLMPYLGRRRSARRAAARLPARGRRRVSSTVALAILGTFAVITADLSSAARLVPTCILVPTAALIVWQLMRDWRPGILGPALDKIDGAYQGRRDPDPRDTGSPWRRELAVLAGLGLSCGCLALFGFLLAVPVLTLLYMRTVARSKWLISGLMALGLWALLYGLLEQGLDATLYRGLVWSAWKNH